MSSQVTIFLNQLNLRVPLFATLDEAISAARKDVEGLLGPLSGANESDFAEACAIKRKELESEFEILHSHSLFRRHSPQWYKGTGPGHVHWPALRSYLINSKGFSEENVESIDRSSNEVVSLLADPARSEFSYRGLVVGYVQSGKTANMTAVIAKAVDAGYNFVVVLAGLTNVLRLQTQRRLEADLTARHRYKWNLLTSDDDAGDFRLQANRQFPIPSHDHLQFAVLKKNVAPLRQFLMTLERTSPQAKDRMRVLVIDDECDQASVNSAGKDYDATAINEKIRILLSRLKTVTYVGYTATPFANVLINPYPDGSDRPDDLYPQDFITSLPKPEGYFGTEELFGRPPVDADNPAPEEEGYDVINFVPDEDIPRLQPARAKDTAAFEPSIPGSLEDAMLYFLACCAARRMRSQAGKHMSMLIHTSARVKIHDRVAERIKAWVAENRDDLSSGKGKLAERMSSLWASEQDRLAGSPLAQDRISIEQIIARLPDVLDALEVPVENGFSDDRIDYSGDPRTYIVVGGTVLARGLTIEGLMVSYFLRTSNQYDTLLQMGRWFGFRPGYKDLPRIWTTPDLMTAFRGLAGVEGEIRQDIAEYAARKVTPLDFAVRIRQLPGMAITAASKMKAARVCDISYSGRHVQTIRFQHRDAAVVEANWRAADGLITRAAAENGVTTLGDRSIFRSSLDAVVQFLRAYRFHPEHRELGEEFLLKYIQGQSTPLAEWNVGIIQSGKASRSERSLGPVRELGLVTRARLDAPPADTADIKALMSLSDVLYDCPSHPEGSAQTWEQLKVHRKGQVGHVPLLLLYPVDARSEPRKNGAKGARIALDAVSDLIGVGIVFPGSSEGGGEFVSVNLDPISVDEIDTYEQALGERGAQDP
jgi:hypothetical protein